MITGGDNESEVDDESFSAAVAALMTLKPRITIDSIDGVAALESPRVGILAAMRFHSDGRSLVFDGLHGPAPARSRAGEIKVNFASATYHYSRALIEPD